MNIAIGTDHRGFTLKNEIKHLLTIMTNGESITWIDVGCFSIEDYDYPLAAKEVVDSMRSGKADFGLLLCGTGVGMSIAANRFKGIYASLVWTQELALLAREHDNANILVLPADYVTIDQAISMINAWLSATFAGGRHQRRINEIDFYTNF